MPFFTRLHKAERVESSLFGLCSSMSVFRCLLPAETSIRPALRRRFRLKRTQLRSTNRSSLCRESKPTSTRDSDRTGELHPMTHSYDMTILHAEELDDTHLAMRRRRRKTIPYWANKDQLQLAIVNQVYFQENNPEEIFGRVRVDLASELINSIVIENRDAIPVHLSRHPM